MHCAACSRETSACLPAGRQVAELCEAANQEVQAGQGVRIANFLCNGNYAVSGGLAGCEAVEKLAKSFKARWGGGAGAMGHGPAHSGRQGLVTYACLCLCPASYASWPTAPC